MSWLLALGACSPDTDALDSSENLISSPPNVVQALTLDVPWSCRQFGPKRKRQKLPLSVEQGMRLLKAAECENRELNENYPQQTRITVAVYRPDFTSDTIMYMRMVVLSFVDSTINQAASKLLRMGGFPATADTSTAIIESATGHYKVRSYLRAIRATTPLVVFLPMKIQGKKVTPAIYEAACSRIKRRVLY
ncbi:MAG: hypothetical protein EOO63_13970 [Hymenobacter sp.]|nr:MAG: hypothetical protein EOO63_13970 [Hymenobacter sp.]